MIHLRACLKNRFRRRVAGLLRVWCPRFSVLFAAGSLKAGHQTGLFRQALRCFATRLLLAGLTIYWSGCATSRFKQQEARDTLFEFALIGDVPYNEYDATNSYPNMIAEINEAELAFVVHDGDIKSSGTPCTTELFERCLQQCQSFKHPLILLFGDNEWTDCGIKSTNGLDADAALDQLRHFFCQGNESLGQRRLKLTRQSEQPGYAKFPENVRWTYGDVIFVGLNVPGNDNNFGAPEAAERNRGNLSWVKESFKAAIEENRRAVMIMMQANPHFDLASTNRLRAGFNELLGVLEQETIAFRRPVVLVHGDSHYFRIDKPLIGSKSRRRLENFTRVETFGNPDVHWVRARADWREAEVFTFRQEIVEKNLVDHRKPPPSRKTSEETETDSVPPKDR